MLYIGDIIDCASCKYVDIDHGCDCWHDTKFLVICISIVESIIDSKLAVLMSANDRVVVFSQEEGVNCNGTLVSRYS